jgi:predicted amidohydrolase
MTAVRIALGNLRYPGTPEESVRLACAAIMGAARERALIICFPEVYVPGYRVPGRPAPPPNAEFLEHAWARIATTARDAGVAVVLGTERIVDGWPRITALIIDVDGTRKGFQDKVQLDPAEENPYVPGTDRQVFRVGPLTFGVAICHEGFRYPETVRWAARLGAEVVFHPHLSWAESDSFRPTTFADPRNSFHEKAILCRAAENTCFMASVNCAMEGSPTTSAVVRPDGTVVAWQPYNQEGLLVVDIETDEATGLLAKRYAPERYREAGT